ncbi:autophagy protein 5 [Delitschia confertaspora ATCC 74209]|uniref:Autophagy protein 5 n=1 Tax=Delitschia confertaspora ATCC 74209 TaxID=1513339 RepID=A0A9P4MXL8_9PLEO|nr:autophagy protein 5 [Delitschia confertaspora ATCC 74209]
MSTARDLAHTLQKRVWDGSIPLEIRLASADCRSFDDSDPYLIQFPRLSYLAFLIPRLHAFLSRFLIDPDVSPTECWLEYQGVPLKWHYPLGLLYDLYSGSEPAYPSGGTGRRDEAADEQDSLPWKLTVHFTEMPMDQLFKLDVDGKVLHDAFINSVKEADFLRNGTAKTVMSLSKEDSTQLWEGVKQFRPSIYNPINQKLLNPQGSNLRHLPIKLYLPHASSSIKDSTPTPGSLRVVQTPITPALSSRQPQTVGTALNQILPTLFPSRRSPLLAQAVLHGAILPLSTPIEDLTRVGAYLDGWLHIVIVMMG